MTTPRASVIVPTYGDWQALAGCLGCLAAQTVPADSFEIVVGNNNPVAEIPVGFALPANARVVWAPRPGSYAARNAAVAEARGAVFFFTDSDCRPAADWIEAGLAALAAGGERLAGAVEIVPAGREWTIPELYDRIFELQQARYVRKNYAATANLIVTRALFERAGRFDEGLMSSGDKEWNGRAAKVGERIRYVPEAVVRHPARASFEALAKKRVRVLGGRLATRRKKRRRTLITLVKFLFPAPATLVRILRFPGLGPVTRLRLWLLDYRLRLVEFRATLALRSGAAGMARE